MYILFHMLYIFLCFEAAGTWQGPFIITFSAVTIVLRAQLYLQHTRLLLPPQSLSGPCKDGAQNTERGAEKLRATSSEAQFDIFTLPLKRLWTFAPVETSQVVNVTHATPKSTNLSCFEGSTEVTAATQTATSFHTCKTSSVRSRHFDLSRLCHLSVPLSHFDTFCCLFSY